MSMAVPARRSVPACSVGKSLCVSINSADACTRFTSASLTVRFCATSVIVISKHVRILFCIAPVVSHADVHHQRHVQPLDALHLRFHHSAHGVHLFRRRLEHQLIM